MLPPTSTSLATTTTPPVWFMKPLPSAPTTSLVPTSARPVPDRLYVPTPPVWSPTEMRAAVMIVPEVWSSVPAPP